MYIDTCGFVRSVSELVQHCAASNFSNDLWLKDALCMRLEHVLRALEKALHILDSTQNSADVESLRQLHLCANQYERVLLSSLNTCSVVSTINPLHKRHVVTVIWTTLFVMYNTTILTLVLACCKAT